MQIVKIVTEFPAGKQIFNRAVNRHKLDRLKDQILPRREQALVEIIQHPMPDEIREDFEARELKLISSALKAIGHREHFEERAQKNVSTIMERFFSKFEPRKFQPKHLTQK